MYAEKPYCEGELILCQEPLALGPPCTVLKRICVACLSPTKNSTTCYQCEWPLCDVACSKLQHHQAECDMFRNLLAKYATSDERNALHRYEGILPLRILLLKDDDRSFVFLRSELTFCDKIDLYKVKQKMHFHVLIEYALIFRQIMSHLGVLTCVRLKLL